MKKLILGVDEKDDIIKQIKAIRNLEQLFKAASSKGLSYYVFVGYSYPLATLALLPLIFIFPSTTTVVPPFKFSLLLRIFLLSSIGVLSQTVGYIGIAYSSPTLSAAITNTIPAFTFTLAILFSCLKMMSWIEIIIIIIINNDTLTSKMDKAASTNCPPSEEFLNHIH
ncbi:hypothetical protein CISIN_1g042874mg, partial [Citrus sinensis]